MARDAALKAKNQIERVEGLLDMENRKKDGEHEASIRRSRRKPLRRSQQQTLQIDNPPQPTVEPVRAPD
jgi:hypothetical protein